jgi:uncharacterized protein (TIGR04222 family)
MRLVSSSVLTVLLVVLGAAAPASAQGFGERISSYDIDLSIEDDGDLLVQETIEYDFGGAARRGIERFIPVRFPYEPDDRYERVYPIDVLDVETSAGTPGQTQTSTASNNLVIRIGDPDRTITGRHTYRITYRVTGALNGFDDHDELFWNVIGGEWAVPIDRASVTATLPGDVTQVACYSGPVGSRLPCDESSSTGATATFAHSALSPQDAMTVVVGFPTGLVPTPEPVLDERWTVGRAFALTPVTGAASGGMALAGVGAVAALGWRHGRDRRYVGGEVDIAFGNDTGQSEPVPLGGGTPSPVEFVPPDGLRPGQVGTLVDEVAHPLDVTATIVDLAVRGYLRIEEVEQAGWFGQGDWLLRALDKAPDDLHTYEHSLHTAIFAGGPEVLLSDLKGTFATSLAQVQSELYDDAVDQGWFVTRPDHIRAMWTGIGIAVVVSGVVLTGLAAAFTSYGLVPLPLVLAGLLLLAFASRMPHRTAKGTGVVRRVHGFRMFIEESEKERARFAERANLFSEYLPYAIVFGATEKWARAFAGLDGALPDTGGWYVGHHGGLGFNYLVFSGAMGGFTTTTAGTIASTPTPTAGTSGFSGFGGGGFSGGGGGGGGGGSW